MSKIKVNSIEAATGSTITIPSGQTLDISSTTLTLPSTVVTTTGTQTLTNKTIGVSQLTGTLPVANGGTGLTTLGSATQVLRVNSGATALEFGTVSSKFVAYEYAETFSTSSHSVNNADSDTGLTVSITPSSASNKILVVGKICTGTASSFGGFGMYLKRGSTIIGTPTSGGSGVQQRYHSNFINTNYYSADELDAGFFFFLDSPATTSATTYLVGYRGVSGVSSIYMNRNNADTYRGYSSIMAIELQT
jgi:LysM repeat protein